MTLEAVASSDGGAESGANQRGLAYNASVLFMLGMPFVLVGGLSTKFYLAYRKQKANDPGSASKRTP